MGSFDVVLLPTFSQVEAYRKRTALDDAPSLFSCTVTTFAAWIADLWELHGDGRRLVDSLQREVVMRAAFKRVYGDETPEPGVAPLAATCMKKAAGVHAFEQALDRAGYDEAIEGIDKLERRFLAGMSCYRDLLIGPELIELGHACAYLASRQVEVFPHEVTVRMVTASPLDWIQRQLFEECSNVKVVFEPLSEGDGIAKVSDETTLSFGFPSGVYAQAGLVADCIRDCVSEGPVVVACAHPLDMYKSLEQELADEHTQCGVVAQVKFGQIDFGKTVLSLLHCINDDPFDAAALSDVMLSPFSGIRRSEAIDLDRLLRADRIAERGEWLQLLCAKSDYFSQLDELVRDPDASVLLGSFEQGVMMSQSRSLEWRSEQLGAINAMRKIMEAARVVHLPMEDCAKVLEQTVVTVTFAGCTDGDSQIMPQVTVTAQSAAATMEAGSCATLIVADLTSEEYPVSDTDDAATMLLGKLGLLPVDSAIARARRTFNALLRLPSSHVMLVRPLNDVNADPTYPAVVLEELIDVYRDDPTATDDIDNVFSLPEHLMPGMFQRGEEMLYQNAGALIADDAQPCADLADWPSVGDLGTADPDLVVLPAAGKDGVVFSKPRLSPSQLELYMECPHQWLVGRRLGTEQLDEQFGPLEVGTFMHAALEAFYRKFQAAGHPKVNEGNLELAKKLMFEVFQDLVELMKETDPGDGRLVAKTQLEQWELDSYGKQLLDYLDFEAQLLPTFHPAYFEYVISPDDGVEYAGCLLSGKIDRIDVDDRGRAVIVDYKGSIDGEYEIGGKTPLHVGKIQTRIYAQAVKRLLGLDVVGAIYVSYSRRHKLAGALDPSIEAAHLPAASAEKCRCGNKSMEEFERELAMWAAGNEEGVPEDAETMPSYADCSFDAMLNLTESRVSQAVKSMLAGNVEPAPSNPAVCRYCPAPICPKRGE